MSQWTNEYAILRDLSVAQGRVPVAIEGTVGAGDKPPSLNITEETEEEFFKHCSADGDVSAAPDLGLIKKMLDMVRDINVSSDEEFGPDKALIISKLNPLSSEFVPKNNNTSTPLDQSPKKQVKPKKSIKKRQRNIAVESILQALADNKQIDEAKVTLEPVKLLKPNDFIVTNDVNENSETISLTKSVELEKYDENVFDKNDQLETKPNQSKPEIAITKDVQVKEDISAAPTVVEKVNGWFKTQTESPFPKKAPKVILEATNMFKKKSVTEKVKKVEVPAKSPTSNNGDYKPSVLANEYYQKYVERSKFKESVKEDIWTKAEKKMKEIDEKRRRELTQTLTSPSSTSHSSDETQSFEETQSTDYLRKKITTSAKIERCLNIVSLPQHRHKLTGECVVCRVLIKKPNDQTNGDTSLENVVLSDDKTDEGQVSEDISTSDSEISDDES